VSQTTPRVVIGMDPHGIKERTTAVQNATQWRALHLPHCPQARCGRWSRPMTVARGGAVGEHRSSLTHWASQPKVQSWTQNCPRCG
jgi:hypothetical protein